MSRVEQIVWHTDGHAAGQVASAGVPPILLVSELFPPAIGGSGVLLKNVYGRLAGIPIDVLTDAGEAAEDVSDGEMRILRRRIAARDWGVRRPSALVHHLTVAARIRALSRHAAPVVHCARVLPEGLAAWLAARLGGPRYVCWTHGEELAYARASRELTALMRIVHRGAAAIVANSHNTAGLLEGLGVAAERIHVVHPGVDADRFHPDADRGIGLRPTLGAPDEVIVLSVGRLQRRKGHDLALRAVAALKHISPRIKYVVVGDGRERVALREMAQALEIEDRVMFAGAVDDAVLPAYFAACDVFLLPNRVEGIDFEGFGIVFLEAAASGKPAIGGATGGVSEAIENGVTGLLVGGRDVGELASALERLVGAPRLRARMGDAARKRAQREFGWRRAAAAVERLHRNIGMA